jgi:hypothetical protein
MHQISHSPLRSILQDGVLEMSLLKRNRKGHYEDGTTNADTYWRSVVRGAAAHETLQLEHPPTAYYWSHCEGERAVPKMAPAERARLAAQRGQAAAALPAAPEGIAAT